MGNLLEQFAEHIMTASKDMSLIKEFVDTMTPPHDADFEANNAFKGHYCLVMNFSPPENIDEDGLGSVVSIALKAAALRAGTKVAKLPLMVVDTYLQTLSTAQLDEFFQTMYEYLCMSASALDGTACTMIQDVYFFMEYSVVAEEYMMEHADMQEYFASVLFTPELDECDIQLINDYKKAFFLSDLDDESILLDCILHPENFKEEEIDNDAEETEEDRVSGLMMFPGAIAELWAHVMMENGIDPNEVDAEPFPDAFDDDEEDGEDN